MKIKINYQNLTDSSYSSSANTNAFIFDDAPHLKDAMEQLKADLKHDFPSVFLVSGYRGVGKTSMIEKVVDDLEKDPTTKKKNIIVKLPVTKYKDHKDFLWKLIRALYLAFEKEVETQYKKLNTSYTQDLIPRDKRILSQPKQKKDNLNENFKLLSSYFERTFNTINKTKSLETKHENTETETFEFDFKKFIAPLTVLFAGSSNLFYALGKWIDVELIYLLITIGTTVGGAIWTASSYKAAKTKKKTDTKVDKFESKELFDEDIAEYRIIELLENFKKDDYQVIIILDELDKIEDKKKLNVMLSHLKGLLLSNHARFILIDSLYIQRESNKPYQENNVLDSIFSKKLHINLPTKAFYQKWFHEYILQLGLAIGNANDNFPAIRSHFISHFILRSFRIPRKVNSYISQKVNWENGNAIIHLYNGHIRKLIKQDHQRIRCIEETIQTALSNISGYKRDIYIAHLHRWAIDLIRPHKQKQSEEEILVLNKINPKNDFTQLSQDEKLAESTKAYLIILFTAFQTTWNNLTDNKNTVKQQHDIPENVFKLLRNEKGINIFKFCLDHIKKVIQTEDDTFSNAFFNKLSGLPQSPFKEWINQVTDFTATYNNDTKTLFSDNPLLTQFATYFFRGYTRWLLYNEFSKEQLSVPENFEMTYRFTNLEFETQIKVIYKIRLIHHLNNEADQIIEDLKLHNPSTCILMVFTSQNNTEKMESKFYENSHYKSIISPFFFNQEIARKLTNNQTPSNHIRDEINSLEDVLKNEISDHNLRYYCDKFRIDRKSERAKELLEKIDMSIGSRFGILDIHKGILAANGFIKYHFKTLSDTKNTDNFDIDILAAGLLFMEKMNKKLLSELSLDQSLLSNFETFKKNTVKSRLNELFKDD